MAKFELVSKYAGCNFLLPKRATANSAGYDLRAAESVIIEPYEQKLNKMYEASGGDLSPRSLEEIAALTKKTCAKPTLVSTGLKCKLDPGYYLKLVSRSSMPLKTWLVVANGEGVIDADYFDNIDNEGEIFFQFINLSAFPISIHPGEKIGQAIIVPYGITEDDNAAGKRTGGFGSTDK